MGIDLATLPLDDRGMDLLDPASDEQLIAAVAEALSVPRTRHNSFTLHAPLELLARAELLSLVDSDRRRLARLRLAALGQGFLRSGDAVPSAPGAQLDGPAEAVATLVDAVGAADPNRADAATTWLAAHDDAPGIARLVAGPVLRELGAAGHAPILFASYLRLPQADARPLRGVARQMAEHADLRVGADWYARSERPTGSIVDFERTLLSRAAGDDPRFGIYPLVAAAHRDGVLRAVPCVADGDVDEAFRVLWRVAARSMLEDDPDHAPYGWTHALTMPLGLYQTADLHGRVGESLDLATLLLAGFRHAHGRAPLPESTPEPEARVDEDELASAASVEHDAHLVKYVLACRHAARLDPDRRTLYECAANRLVAWWASHPAPDDPIASPTAA